MTFVYFMYMYMGLSKAQTYLEFLFNGRLLSADLLGHDGTELFVVGVKIPQHIHQHVYKTQYKHLS